MKFTDGNWLVREGYQIHFPKIVYEVQQENQSLLLYAPCKQINHRGDTLDGPLLTIKLTAPIEGVIRVQTWHYRGGKEKFPAFAVTDNMRELDVQSNETDVICKSGDVSVAINKQTFALSFIQGERLLAALDSKGLAWIDGPQGKTYMRGQMKLSVGEQIYGLGERFTPFVKNGQSIDSWNEDGGTSSEQSYKNIPFYLSSKGYGIFVNHPEKVSFELGSELVSRTQFSVEGEYLDYYVISGPSPKAVIGRYTELTGRPALPPAWSFGLWLSTSFTTDYNEATVNHFVDGMTERGIPLSVFHFDCFWMKAFEWSSFIWDRRNFPDPAAMLQRLKDKNLYICVWINPYIAQKSPLFTEAIEKGYLLKKTNGDVWQWDRWQAGMGIVDFTNPDAVVWFQSKLKVLLDMGVDSFKTDFGERIPTDVIYADGSDPNKMHNYYAYLYNEVVFDLLKHEKGVQDAVVFARAATAGSQKFPVHWGGDCDSTYEAMAESLRGGLSLTTSGFGYWSHDIGGFENTATPDVFKRWTAFGLLSSHSRFHGSASYRVPWQFDQEAVNVARHFTQLKNRLMPYLYAHAVENHLTGIPIMRAMHLEFPEDPLCEGLDRQYMLGNALLVAPIFNPEGLGSFYLPKGKWTHLLTGQVIQGGTWVKENYDYFSLPIFVRENTLLPIGKEENTPVYAYQDQITLQLYTLQEGYIAEQQIVDSNGSYLGKFVITRDGNTLKCWTDVPTSYQLELINHQTIQSTTSGKVTSNHEKVTISVAHGVDQVTIEL